MNLEMKKSLVLVILFTLFLKLGESKPTLAHVIVSKDDSGHFKTINEAIKAAPNYSRQKYYIHIKSGTYKENVVIGMEKTNIVLLGEGVGNTVICQQKSFGSGFDIWNGATLQVSGDDFMAQDLTIENTAGPEMQQAVAVAIRAEHSTFYKCQLKGFQDTLFVCSGSQFFRQCEISGTIDFIFGNSKLVLQNCVITGRKPLQGQGIVLAASKREDETEDTGIIFHNCTITAEDDLRKEQTDYFFGRPWGDYARVVIMQSEIDGVVNKEGWIQWDEKPIVSPYFGEYDNGGPGATTAGRVNWSRKITDPKEASQFTVRHFLQGQTWIPSGVPYQLDLFSSPKKEH